jgi:hypothetical protein
MIVVDNVERGFRVLVYDPNRAFSWADQGRRWSPDRESDPGPLERKAGVSNSRQRLLLAGQT